MQRQASGRFPALLLIAILLLVAVGWTLRLLGESKLLAAEERFDAETGSLSLADYVRPGLEDKENAAIWLRAGAEALQISAGDVDLMAEVLDQDFELWSAETREAAAALIDANAPALEQLEKCVGLEDSNFDLAYEEGFSAVIPPMLDLYRAGRLVAMDLRLALAAADSERTSRDLEILDQLSWALARESFLVSSLIHLGVERLFLGAVRDVVEAGLEDWELLSELEGRLGQRDSMGSLRRSISGEAAAVLSATDLRGTPMDSSTRWDRLRFWFLEPFQLAALLDTYGEVVESLERPWIETLEWSRSGRKVGWAAHEFLLTNLFDSVDKLKATQLGQLLAAQALQLRQASLVDGELRGSLLGDITDPYAAGSVVYEVAADGSADLSAPEAIELWRSEHAGADERQRPVFMWQLPAPGD